ncbi:MAG TPA: methylated-DNA--[protein]-cysteine S-methyltransferase [Allosphingosinicella sp.]|nr:methylated-DNA--[protein]-cysteine S-methyltransferase [Allosphingosinicella sp.]
MSSAGLAKFETPIGTCAIAWGPSGLLGVQLPGASELAALARLQKRYPFADEAVPPPAIAAIVARIAAFLGGASDDFADLPYDFSQVSDFEAGVYREALAIPAGATSTYGAIAAKLGDRGRSRAVGRALGHNPWPIVVPCHRVTGADGKMGGFSAPGGRATKLRLLEIEGALAPESLPLFGAAP